MLWTFDVISLRSTRLPFLLRCHAKRKEFFLTKFFLNQTKKIKNIIYASSIQKLLCLSFKNVSRYFRHSTNFHFMRLNPIFTQCQQTWRSQINRFLNFNAAFELLRYLKTFLLLFPRIGFVYARFLVLFSFL